MTIDEARDIVFTCVKEHGREQAKAILSQRANDDLDFALACAKHGAELLDAMLQASQEPIN